MATPSDSSQLRQRHHGRKDQQRETSVMAGKAAAQKQTPNHSMPETTAPISPALIPPFQSGYLVTFIIHNPTSAF
ncbi:MAG: hypothetical protein JXR37_11950 [Kiritimatiellae bacterium]|nr:hypothetical protein [Kiritimatiellia bacterium]